MSQNPQNPVIRRAYVVRASNRLLTHLAELGEGDLAETFSAPSIVMTQPLPYEGKLEGYRSLILAKCKSGFVADLHDFLGEDQCVALFGDLPAVALFDAWWQAEEADAIEIATDW